MKKGLTVNIVFKAQSLNYGEGIGNISELKKLTRADGNMYTFASRQALRYDVVRLGNEFFNWNLQVVDKAKGTIQFRDDLSIEDSQESYPRESRPKSRVPPPGVILGARPLQHAPIARQ